MKRTRALLFLLALLWAAPLVLKGAGHIPQAEQPELFFGAVEAFLRGAPVPGAKAPGGAR